MQGCLAEGFPFTFGFTVYDSFENDSLWKNGVMPLPKQSEQILGGHQIYCVGYITIAGRLYFICANSWSPSWQLKGFFLMPSTFIIGSDVSDLQTLRAVE